MTLKIEPNREIFLQKKCYLDIGIIFNPLIDLDLFII